MLWLCFSWHTCYLDQRMQYFDHLCFSSEALLLCLDLYIFSFSWTRFSRHWFIWAVVSQVDANIGENYPQDSLAEVFLWVRGLEKTFPTEFIGFQMESRGHLWRDLSRDCTPRRDCHVESVIHFCQFAG